MTPEQQLPLAGQMVVQVCQCRVAQEAAADLVMTGDLPLMQLPMALLVEVVHQDRDPMVTVDILVMLPKMVM